MSRRKPKPLYTVTLRDLSHTVEASSATNASVKAFRYWIASNLLKDNKDQYKATIERLS